MYSAAYAQALPSAADASRIRPADTIRPEQPPIVSGGKVKEIPHVTPVPDGAEKVFLTLHSVTLEGNTVLTEEELSALYAPLIGQKIPVSRLYALADSITRLYRERGFAFSFVTIPPQELGRKADVKLRVVEGYIASVHVQGDVPEAVKARAEAYAQRLLAERPVTIDFVERQLLLINDLPGVKAESTLSPAAGDGAIAIDIELKYRPLQARAGVDSYGNNYLGPIRGYGTGQWNALATGVDSVQLSGMTTSDAYELRNAELMVDKNIGTDGLHVQASIARTSTHPSLRGASAVLKPEGSAQIVRLGAQYPLVRSRALNWQVGTEFNATDNSTHFAQGFSPLETSDHIRSLRVSTALQKRDAWSGYNSVQLEFSKGINALGSSKKGDPMLSRARGNPQYTKWLLNASRIQNLGPHFTGLLAVSGQHSPSALLTAEEFGVGGYQFGRGFDSSEITGDQGVAAKLEVSYYPDLVTPYMSDPSLFVFYDGGAVWNKDPGAGQGVRQSLTSAGIGARSTIANQVRTEFYVAKPLTNVVASRASDKQDNWRAMMNVYVEY